MRTTVSDILLFQKCPYAWYIKSINKRERAGPKSSALEHGTSVHLEFAKFFLAVKEDGIKAALGSAGGITATLSSGDKQKLEDMISKYEILEIEEPLVVDVGGHTLDCRPDGVLRAPPIQTRLLQLKSSSANKAHHVEIVRYSVHECMYSLGVAQKFDHMPMETEVIRYVKTSSGKVSLHLDRVSRTKGDIEAAKQYVIRMCDQMEDLTLGERAEGWQVPPSCIDWTTGQRCEYFDHCHHGSDLAGPGWQAVPDRYLKEQGTAEAGGSEDQG